jgi:hypothetical protein
VSGAGGYDFDLAVIGSGPAGQAAAVEAARNGLSVALVEQQRSVGGVCLHTGTVPSKALREAVLGLTNYHASCLYRGRRGACEPGAISMDELRVHIEQVVEKELSAITTQVRSHGISLLHGSARFTGPHEVALSDCETEARLSPSGPARRGRRRSPSTTGRSSTRTSSSRSPSSRGASPSWAVGSSRSSTPRSSRCSGSWCT